MRLGISACNRLNDLDFISPLEPAESANNRSLSSPRDPQPQKDGGEPPVQTQALFGLVRAKGHDWPRCPRPVFSTF